ncbi:4-hydroxyphenylacetate 3-monooxygenase, oxygenase component [Bacillus songklensis]|uniref:4-hydroxyphenylacetate 3-monooxygenase, oxygenase component n=1 Tax=Bacillus songklensis TaxID=1069116 RepID=A0ABV8AZH9_9BACI
MPAISGKQYIDRINAMQPNVWIHGKKVEGNISSHPAFSGVMKSQAALYDMQVNPALKDLMTYASPKTGERVGTSFMQPLTKEDLEKRRLATWHWANATAGMMGRSPDYMNTALMGFASAADVLRGKERAFADNLRLFYEKAREEDLSFTHTYVNPQVNRSGCYAEKEDNIVAARIVDETDDGIVIQGARLLATQGGITDEMIVYSTGGKMFDDTYAFAFSVPSNAEGLTFICRESFSYDSSTFNHPLGSRFEEMDAIVVFNRVTVPWDRVFFYHNLEAANQIFLNSSYTPLVLHQVVSRQVVKTEFVLGVAQLMVDMIEISRYQHVQEKMSEIIIGLESIRALLLASEWEAKQDRWGTMAPNVQPLYVAINTYPRLYPRLMEILQLLGASGLVSIPTEADFSSAIQEDVEHYLQGAAKGGKERVKLFRLAWDMCMSAFGTRQTLYERFFFGDPVRLAGDLYWGYDRKECKRKVEEFLNMKKENETS